FSLAMIITQGCFSQSIYDDLNSTSTPSKGNSFSPMKENINVNMYTGTADIDLPLVSLPSRELSIPISLSYANSTGIKVQDVASYIGLGWRLNAGGSISRIVRGLPDETANGYIGSSHAGNTINLYANTTPPNNV